MAEAGSFTHAGEDLNLSQSAVSRQVSSLEEDLGVPLFHRHARGLLLTEQGDLLYRTSHEIFGKLETAKAILMDSKARPSGNLKVTTTVGLGSTWLTPRIREFVELYPEIKLSIICDDRELDLGMREADIAIRMTEPTQPDLVKRRLFTVHTHIYAGPEYLKRYGTPKSLAELDEHNLIVYGEGAPASLPNVNWLQTIGHNGGTFRTPIMQVNNIYALLLAVESGVGISALPDYMVYGNNRVIRVLPEVDGPTYDAYFVYAEEQRNSARINVFRDFLINKVRDWRF